MKSSIRTALNLILVAACLAGCAFFTKRTPQLIRDAQTNVVQVVVTNTVQREVWSTNRVDLPGGGIQLQPVRESFAERVTQTNMLVQIQPAIWFTNITLSPVAAGSIQTAGDLAPVPWGGLAAQGLTALAGVVLAGYNWFGKRKAEKEAGVQTDLADTAKSAVDVLVKNVDQVRAMALQIPGYTEKIDASVMKGLKVLQVAAGSDVKSLIAESVDANTSPMSKPTPGNVIV